MEQRKGLIQSVDRALDILEVVRDSAGPVRSTDIAAKVNLGLPTAHNIIRSLYARGYLAQDENNRYLPGPECFKMSGAVGGVFDGLKRAVAIPVRTLAEETGDTTFFGAEYFGSLYCVALQVGGGQLVVSGRQDWLELLHCTAAGKIIIAEKGVKWFAAATKAKTLRAYNQKTITTMEGMALEVEKIKNSGHALCVDECGEGVAALGVAVRNKDGKLLGSLAQSFPTLYLDNGKIKPAERAELLRRHAATITEAYRA